MGEETSKSALHETQWNVKLRSYSKQSLQKCYKGNSVKPVVAANPMEPGYRLS
jgi:hypothetical protein